ncbi:MAG TPA: hypothetical protein DCQ31_03845 [Bacteroidales bacterium]|nr:hypothetical protein [Bacteroidales bacterium]
MKTIHKPIYILALMITALISCKTELNYDFELEQPKLVVNGKLIADSAIEIRVTRSMNLLELQFDKYLTNAVVKLYENNTLLGIATHRKAGYYYLENKVKANTNYRIEVSCAGFESVWAETFVPNYLQEILVDTIPVVTDYGYTALQLELTIHDELTETNYYDFFVTDRPKMYYDFEARDSIIVHPKIYLESNDNSIITNINESEVLITDKLFNGGTKRIRFWAFLPSNDYAYFNLAHISESLYKFLTDLEAYDKAKENPLAEQNTVFSNINGGYGIFGGAAIKTDSIYFKEQPFKK